MAPELPPLSFAARPSVTGLERERESFLSYLAFQNHPLRVSVELLSILSLFVALQTLFQSLPANGATPYSALIAWLVASAVIAFFDLRYFLTPLFSFRQSQLFALAGAFPEALEALEQVGPLSAHPVKCPKQLYHLRRAQILMFQGEFAAAHHEAGAAESAGLSLARVSQLRIEIARMKGDFDEASRELSQARMLFPQNPSVEFEEGLNLLSQRKSFRIAAKHFENARDLPSALHWSGEDFRFLAPAFAEACHLWTGRAEEALPRLSNRIAQVLPLATNNESLRFHAALLLLERGFYCATHSEPLDALSDVRTALNLCRYPAIIQGAQRIEEELSWRYQAPSSGPQNLP